MPWIIQYFYSNNCDLIALLGISKLETIKYKSYINKTFEFNFAYS